MEAPRFWWDGSNDAAERVVILSGAAPPWRDSALGSAISALEEEPRSIVLISTPVGLIPSLLKMYPHGVMSSVQRTSGI